MEFTFLDQKEAIKEEKNNNIGILTVNKIKIICQNPLKTFFKRKFQEI